ncbi:hypothetical protein [Mucilaginibacter jinjuensis]|uniref:Uncharacterized protein n=1 Tax=Mucilaginibacter jinjuensis TaxID=1176721 RepID=A0ABY7TB57_9SPHI|nr:hypothetical protein [Mucilaginibacter jinjuensis]WCT13438.1 hypothetical protein PQO05_05760 [Mucilaginibacter jinjuensis]
MTSSGIPAATMLPPFSPTPGPNINDSIAGRNNARVMFYHNDRIARTHQQIEPQHQPFYIRGK